MKTEVDSLGRGTAWEVRRGGRCGRGVCNRGKKRVYRFKIRFGRERRASRLPCLSLGLGDERRRTSRSGDVSLAIFITSVSGRESLASFTNRIFHFSDHQALGWRLMRPKGTKDLAAFSAREVKRVAAEERERDEYSSARQ